MGSVSVDVDTTVQRDCTVDTRRCRPRSHQWLPTHVSADMAVGPDVDESIVPSLMVAITGRQSTPSSNEARGDLLPHSNLIIKG